MPDLRGARVALLMESDYYEPEIFYYQRRFAEEGMVLDLLTRLWGQPQITFTGHEYRAPLTVNQGLDGLSDDDLRSYDAIIVPSGMGADRGRALCFSKTISPIAGSWRKSSTPW